MKLNTKSEILNPKQFLISKSQYFKSLEFEKLEFRTYLEFRV